MILILVELCSQSSKVRLKKRQSGVNLCYGSNANNSEGYSAAEGTNKFWNGFPQTESNGHKVVMGCVKNMENAFFSWASQVSNRRTFGLTYGKKRPVFCSISLRTKNNWKKMTTQPAAVSRQSYKYNRPQYIVHIHWQFTRFLMTFRIYVNYYVLCKLCFSPLLFFVFTFMLRSDLDNQTDRYRKIIRFGGKFNTMSTCFYCTRSSHSFRLANQEN